jgi:hypothetical protein
MSQTVYAVTDSQQPTDVLLPSQDVYSGPWGRVRAATANAVLSFAAGTRSRVHWTTSDEHQTVYAVQSDTLTAATLLRAWREYQAAATESGASIWSMSRVARGRLFVTVSVLGPIL